MARQHFAENDMIDGVSQIDTPDALYELGLMYANGRDVEADLIQAHKWFNLAALRGSEDGKRLRREIATDMSKQEIFEAQRVAREWLANRR